MRRTIVFLAYAFALLSAVLAENEDQILVFRKSGTVDLFYQQELDSITLSKYDCDSILHEKYTTQVFHTADTAMMIPIAEIDSVAFGSRNVVEYQENVKNYTESGREWITDYDGECVYFRTDTPDRFLPKMGEVVFYGDQDDVFACGLAAKALSVTRRGADIAVRVADVELHEVFKRLFYAGDGEDASALTRAEVTGESLHLTPGHTIKLGAPGSINLKGDLYLTPKYVVNIGWGKDYCHSEMNVRGDISAGVSLEWGTEEPIKKEAHLFSSRLSPVCLVLFPRIDIRAFMELTAKLDMSAELKRGIDYTWSWTKKNGESTSSVKNNLTKSKPDIRILNEMTLDGELFVGIDFVPSIALVGVAGVKADIKVGPSFAAHLHYETLADLKEYSGENYLEGSLKTSIRLDADVIGFVEDLFHPDKEIEKTLFSYSKKFVETEIPLFPQFHTRRSVSCPEPGPVDLKKEISVAVKDSMTLVQKELEVGFELVDKDGEAVDSIFVTPMKNSTVEERAYSTVFNVEEEDISEWKVRPIFHYAGYTVRHADIPVAEGAFMQPYSVFLSDGSFTIISSYPIMGDKTIDDKTYHQGAYIPLPDKSYEDYLP